MPDEFVALPKDGRNAEIRRRNGELVAVVYGDAQNDTVKAIAAVMNAVTEQRAEQKGMMLHAFLVRRPRDTQAWPLVYQDEKLAEANEFRVSPVVSVWVPLNPV